MAKKKSKTRSSNQKRSRAAASRKQSKKKSKAPIAAKRKTSTLRTSAKRSSARKRAVSRARAVKPPRTNWVNPYLTVRDVQAAIDFYQNAFGFELRVTMPGPDGKIMHAELTHNESLVMLGPENPDMGALAPQGQSPVTLYTYVNDVDDVASRASSNGGRLVQPPKDEFWGDRCCIIVDPQGHTWMLATHVKDVRPEDMVPPSTREATPPTM